MSLSCSCDDFCKGEFDEWWQGPNATVSPTGETCVECGAAIPEGSEVTVFHHWEVYEPNVKRPFDPEAELCDEPEDFNLARHWEQLYAAMQEDLDAHADAFGWDFDDERYERVTSSDYRCERCSDVASSIEAHGFCLIAPRELIDAHEEFVAMQNNGRRVEWMKRDGVFHPVVTLEAAE